MERTYTLQFAGGGRQTFQTVLPPAQVARVALAMGAVIAGVR